MAAIIRRRGEVALWSSLVALQANGNRIPIFCVPGAGGNLLRLADLAASLGTDQPFYAFQVPGLDGESEPFERVESMAEFFLSQLTAFQHEGPYVIAGYSWGGTVALELAQQLVRRGKAVPLLVILDMAAQSPYYRWIKLFADEWGSLFNLDQIQREDLFIAWRDRIFRLDYFLRRGAREGAARAWRRIQRATPRKVARRLSASLEIAGDTTPVRKQKDFWAQYHLDPLRLEIIRINERTLKLYIPQEYPGKVLLFISSKGEKNPAARSAAPQLGWKQIARGGVESWVIPGGHLEIMEEPGIHTIAEQLRNQLDELNKASQTDPKPGDEAIWYTQERHGAN
jgi:thioesterase domain-containing protein